MTSKVSKVKTYFENTTLYLNNNNGIKTRAKIVKCFAENRVYNSTLDIPCGDGSISFPLINQVKRLTLIDISKNMINLAKQTFSEEKKVEFFNNDIFELDLEANSFDLILCIGILAHVDDPSEFLTKITSLLSHNGVLILQNTDADHFYTRLVKKIRGQKNLIQQNGGYEMNSISDTDIKNHAHDLGLKLLQTYRYDSNLPFISKFLSQEQNYQLTWKIFGEPNDNRFGYLGNKCLYKFSKVEK